MSLNVEVEFHLFPSVCHTTGVVWHTGKVLACDAVGPRFKPRQGQGIL